jgi:hypothetical protein
MATFANSTNQIAALKELYTDSKDYMQDVVYARNPFLALLPKNESPDGMGGKYVPVPIEYSNPQGRSNTFSNAQDQQTAAGLNSFFVTIIQDYQIVTITNLFMEQTQSDASAFIDGAKLMIDGGIRNITNNLAFMLFSDGTGTRGSSTSSSTQNGVVASGTVLPLSNAQEVVNFEVGMLLVASATPSGAISDDTVLVTRVDRANGIVYGTASDASLDTEWAIGTGTAYLSVKGDKPAAGISTNAPALCTAGLAAWIPKTSPSPSESFFGVDRSTDPTRLAGLRFDASSYTIEEGLTSALAFMNREGAAPDYAIMDFASYAALVNALGAKVQYTQVKHDEVDVAFDGITFLSAYGKVTVLADRSCPPQTCYLLTMNTWKLRSLGKVPKILTYGIEGLQGLRVGNADALEIRIAHYSQLICSAPAWNCVVSLSA